MRPAILFPLFADVSSLKGVGPAIGQALGRLLRRPPNILPGVEAGVAEPGDVVRDLVFHTPIGIVDRSFTCPLVEAPEGIIAHFIVTVDEHLPPSSAQMRFGNKPYKVVCSDDSGGTLTLVFFSPKPDYLQKILPVGQKRVISGKTEKFDFSLQITHPDVIAPLSELERVKTADPIYPLTAGLSNRQVTRLIRDALKTVPDLPEWIDRRLLSKHYWRNWKSSLNVIHHPQAETDFNITSPARTRFAYDELLAHQLALGLMRKRQQGRSGHAIRGSNLLRHRLLPQLPFTLTASQDQVLSEIDEDMASGQRMVRLLQGDVGSGKTVVALLAMLRVVENGKQAALMVPTEILGQQHFEFIQPLAEMVGVRVALLTGSVKGRHRTDVLGRIETGLLDIVIGTHALFQEKVVFKDLAMIVVDEQHRFGVAQRMALSAKGKSPHMLMMTATPIPRSLAMTIYGDMDSSILTQKPAGRQKIDTRAVPLSRIEEVVGGLARAMNNGNKIYWICPLIDENAGGDDDGSQTDLAAAEARYNEFTARFGDRVGLVHGRMKGEERAQVMRAFMDGAYDLLVATTVVEVGVNVPDATIMIIEHAERFGLAQLHQLRGRVGRGEKQSSCLLLYSDHTGDFARERLKVIRESDDGFYIAEEDMRLRGSGDIMGLKQSGLPEFHFADLLHHGELVRAARADVKMILESDPDLTSERGEALRTLLYLFEYDVAMKMREAA